MALTKRVRIIKKIREGSGQWRFVSMKRAGARYAWDNRPGYFFVEWWDGPKRRREKAGETPSEAMEAQRRKRNELTGELVLGGKAEAPPAEERPLTPITQAVEMFRQHVRVHSPDKPATLRRYGAVLDHVERILGKKTFAEAITRPDIDDYKAVRIGEASARHKDRRITPRTINFEIAVLRTFFNFLIRERGLPLTNPCERFKPLKDAKAKAKRKQPVYTQAEIDALFKKCDEGEKAIFSTLLLTGLRKEELCFLTWTDLNLADPETATLRVTSECKEGFSPKDYEERIIPLPPELVEILKKLPRRASWVFPNRAGKRETHLLRKLKSIADAAEVKGATLHKFRHTYATRLIEGKSDIVTVQRLMGHSDIDTTRQYLDPDEGLKRRAVNGLTIKQA